MNTNYYYYFLYFVPLDGAATRVIGQGAFARNDVVTDRPQPITAAEAAGHVKRELRRLTSQDYKPAELGSIILRFDGKKWNLGAPTMAPEVAVP